MDEGVGGIGALEKVCGSDSNGVGGPGIDIQMFVGQIVDRLCRKAKNAAILAVMMQWKGVSKSLGAQMMRG